jgi:hypothetical protein
MSNRKTFLIPPSDSYRELSLFSDQSEILQGLTKSFEQDWQTGN